MTLEQLDKIVESNIDEVKSIRIGIELFGDKDGLKKFNKIIIKGLKLSF